jgi:regulation of enolase protein 1 (concanavalin A-like superfamily)
MNKIFYETFMPLIKQHKKSFRHYVASVSLFFFLTLAAHAQKTESLKITSIPHSLFIENSPLSFSVKNNEIELVAGAKTDMFRDPNVTYNTDNAPKILFEADDNFVLTTAIELAFKNKWDGGAIVIRQDSLNWIKFCFEKDYTDSRRVVSVVTKNVSDDCNSVEIKSNKVFYKVAKADNVITLYYSTDGLKWFLIRHLQFDFPKGFHVGFLAQSPTGDKCEVRFSNITYQKKKIRDPYIGE